MSQSLAADARIGPYRLETTIGAGGMGEVYRAFDERLERTIAIKHILPARVGRERTRERFRLEARAVAALNHPAIVRIYDIVTTDDGDWLVMELVDGHPLSEILRDGPLDISFGLPLLSSLADGLVHAHAAGILHRDLKASNVMVDVDGHAKLLDFGLVKHLESSSDEQSLTSEGRLIGTPRAMSPEQALGERLDVRSDLFSFGILLYETFTGENPFSSPHPLRTLHRICFHPQAPARSLNPAIPVALQDLIDQLLEKDRELRPKDAREVAWALEDLCRQVPRPRRDQHPVRLTAARRPAAAPVTGSHSASMTGERRQVTILHCELTSAGDSQILDPEDLIEVRPVFHRLAKTVAGRHRGRLDELLDHGFRLCFGFSEDPRHGIERALQAALDVLRSSPELSRPELFDLEIPAVRIGIHTGPAVFAAEGTGDERLAYGETGVVAAAIQRLGGANSILVSDTSRRLLGDDIAFEPLLPTLIPGRSRPLQAYRWPGESPAG